MDYETILFLSTIVLIGVISYFAFNYLQYKNTRVDNAQKLKTRKNESSEGKHGGDRVATSTTDNMTQSSINITMLEVPSRQRFEEESVELTRERCIENASDNFDTSDNETDGEDKESDHDENDYKAFMSFVNEEKLKEYTDELGVIRGLMKYINENLQTWMSRKLKIAIIGNSGTGKSSLINAIRGLKPEDKGAARVGVTETTFVKQEYLLPSNENIGLWDLPGVGTQNFKKEDYLKTVNLKEFDVFMIVSASRFTGNDIWLASEILKYQSCVLFLRTKIDFDLSNEKSDHPSTYSEASCLQKIRDEISTNLEKANFPSKSIGIFLVSSRQSHKFDFPTLLKKLNKMLSVKRFALRNMLERILLKTLDEKSKLTKGSFFWQKLAVFFNFGNSASHTIRMYERCKMMFSLDDETIKMIADDLGVSVMHLKTKVLKYFSLFEEFLETERRKSFLQTLLFSTDFLSFRTQLNEVCDTLARDEEILINLRLDSLEEQLKPL